MIPAFFAVHLYVIYVMVLGQCLFEKDARRVFLRIIYYHSCVQCNIIRTKKREGERSVFVQFIVAKYTSTEEKVVFVFIQFREYFAATERPRQQTANSLCLSSVTKAAKENPQKMGLMSILSSSGIGKDAVVPFKGLQFYNKTASICLS